MSTADFEALRAQTLEAGERMGWKPLGAAVGIDGETLRAFAKARAGRRVQPDTAQALRDYFNPDRSVIQEKADRAIQLIAEGQALLQQVAHAVRQLPTTPDIASMLERADLPTPDVTPARAKQGKQKRGGSG